MLVHRAPFTARARLGRHAEAGLPGPVVMGKMPAVAREVPQESATGTSGGSRQRCVRYRGTGTIVVASVDKAVDTAREESSHVRETRCPVPGCVDGWVSINDEDDHIEDPE